MRYGEAITADNHRSEGRRGVPRLPARALKVLLVWCPLLGTASSSQAITTACEVQPNSAVSQSGPVNTTLTYAFDIVDTGGGCAPLVTGTIIPGADSTGGASADTLNWSGAPGDTITVIVTLGPTGGGSALFTVACPSPGSCFNGNSTILWTAQTTSGSCNLLALAPTAQTGAPSSTLSYQFGVAESSNCDAAGGMDGTIATTDNTSGALLSQTSFSQNTVAASPYGFDLTLGSATGTETITISCTNNCSTTDTLSYTATSATSADLEVTKDGPATATAGNDITYTVTVTNNGLSDAQSVSLTDATPSNTSFVSASQTVGPAFTCVTPSVGGTGNVTCTITSLAAGASATFSIVDAVNITTPGGTSITNTASATSATTDPTPGNDSASDSTIVNGAPVAAIPALSPLAVLLLTLTIAVLGARLPPP